MINTKLNIKELERIIKNLRELSAMSLTIRIKEGVVGKNGVSVQKYTLYNNEGTKKGIPARPFWNDTFENEANIFSIVRGQVNEIFNSDEPIAILHRIGKLLVKEVQQSILDGSYAPNNPATLKKKGSNKKPLVDEQILLRSIDYEVR